MQDQLIECVPNFSEGRNPEFIQTLAEIISAVKGVNLLNIDPGKATNRTVYTFVGRPECVVKAAFQAIKYASEHIDMRSQSGEHPRMGATDVCPLVPLHGITMIEVSQYAHQLAERVGEELNIPVFMYEYSASSRERENLATIRSGEFEGMESKLDNPNWKPDYGPSEVHPTSGVTAIGARDFLIAYNVNIETDSVDIANEIARDVRESGRLNNEDKSKRIPGMCKGVKAIGWYIEEFDTAQVSMNITDLNATGIHEAYEACKRSASARDVEVNGSEIVGLVPRKALLESAFYFHEKAGYEMGIAESDLLNIAVERLGLNSVKSFVIEERIIEYLLKNGTDRLTDLTIREFSDQLSSDKVAPGGGSVAAAVGSFGTALAEMVAVLSEESTQTGESEKYRLNRDKAKEIRKELLKLIDRDAESYKQFIAAGKLPGNSEKGKHLRKLAIENACLYAIKVPYEIMQKAVEVIPILKFMAEDGLYNARPDAVVGLYCLRTCVKSAFLNICINREFLEDEKLAETYYEEGKKLCSEVNSSVIKIEEKFLNSYT